MLCILAIPIKTATSELIPYTTRFSLIRYPEFGDDNITQAKGQFQYII